MGFALFFVGVGVVVVYSVDSWIYLFGIVLYIHNVYYIVMSLYIQTSSILGLWGTYVQIVLIFALPFLCQHPI